MTTLGRQLRKRREELRWSLEKLAEEASRIEGAPEIAPGTCGYLERCRTDLRIDDPEEPLPYILKALGMEDGQALLKAFGLAA